MKKVWDRNDDRNDDRNYKLWDRNDVFWLAKKWLTLLAFLALIKCYVTSLYNGLDIDIQRFDHEDRLQPSEQLMHHESVQILSILTTFTASYEKYRVILIDVFDDLTRYSYIANLKTTCSWYRKVSKAVIGVKNTASYIPWTYTTWDQMVASNMILCVLVLMTTTITQAFCIKFKQFLFIILKLIPLIQ